MQQEWINRNGHSHLILFFNGWGCDSRIVSHLQHDNEDILALYDYRELPLLDESILAGYSEVTVVAWSFGVWAADYALQQINAPHRRIALCGSLFPVDESQGIPPTIFQRTLETYSDQTRQKFFARIFGSAASMKQWEANLPLRTTPSQQEELAILGNLFEQGYAPGVEKWNKALIAANDLIFPCPNLVKMWGDKAQIIDSPHFPFHLFTQWSNITNISEA